MNNSSFQDNGELLRVAASSNNLIGQFEFSAADSKVDIDSLVERYADPDFWHKSLQPQTEAI